MSVPLSSFDLMAESLESAHATILEQQRALGALHFIVGALSVMVGPGQYRSAVEMARERYGDAVPESIMKDVRR